jgi:uncharacterized protein YcfL
MKNILFLILLSFLFNGCFAQNYSQLETLVKATNKMFKNININDENQDSKETSSNP